MEAALHPPCWNPPQSAPSRRPPAPEVAEQRRAPGSSRHSPLAYLTPTEREASRVLLRFGREPWWWEGRHLPAMSLSPALRARREAEREAQRYQAWLFHHRDEQGAASPA